MMCVGSVNDKNCGDLIKQNDIDGFLVRKLVILLSVFQVGGASLQPAFTAIVDSCNA